MPTLGYWGTINKTLSRKPTVIKRFLISNRCLSLNGPCPTINLKAYLRWNSPGRLWFPHRIK
jgi:hypothetical protein